MSGFGITEFFHIHQFNKTLQLMLGPFTEKYAEPIRDLTYRMRLPMVRYFRIINQSGVLIFHEKSVCSFVPNLLNYPIRFPSFPAYSRIWQDTLGLKRFFKDGRQSPDWCMLFVSKWFLRHRFRQCKMRCQDGFYLFNNEWTGLFILYSWNVGK